MMSKTLSGLLLVAAMARPCLAQAPSPPHYWYRMGTAAYFSIFNNTVSWSGKPPPLSPEYRQDPVNLSTEASGSASQGLMSQAVRVRLAGHAGFGRISYHASLLAEVGGERFVDRNSIEYFTASLSAAGVLEMGYADEIDIGSNTLPHGTNVTIRVRLSYQAGRSATRTWPEWVTVPPTEPGGATTYVQVIRSSSDSEFRTPSTHEAGFQTLRPDGTQQGFVRAERKLAGAVEFNLTAVVGGKLRLTHAFGTHGLEAATRASTGSHGGDRSAALSSTGACFLNLWPVTDGVRLTSRSGAVYAPAAGQGALLQSQVLGANLQLIAPDGAIFQKATSWPASEGLSWTDLPDRQILLVPMNESSSFFRVRLP